MPLKASDASGRLRTKNAARWYLPAAGTGRPAAGPRAEGRAEPLHPYAEGSGLGWRP